MYVPIHNPKSLEKSKFKNFTLLFSQMTFREITHLDSTCIDSLVSDFRKGEMCLYHTSN